MSPGFISDIPVLVCHGFFHHRAVTVGLLLKRFNSLFEKERYEQM